MSSSPTASTQRTPRQASSLSEQESVRLSLLQHLQRLVESDPQAAREALEMSQEQAPELYLIAQNQPSSQWPQSLMSSDSMHSLLSHLDWSKPGKVQPLPQQDSLRSLLEQLP